MAAELADGIITSVKVPADTIENVIEPAARAAAVVGREPPKILATRWSIHAADEDEAWQALTAWRGLRAPGRLEAVDPQDLRERADEMPREEVLGRYTIVPDADAIVDAYRPLCESVGAEAVTFQIASLDQEATIRLLGEEVIPRLRG
jgi:coenzyme F420-dependent glucose-6-phosphate dehydrogenase